MMAPSNKNFFDIGVVSNTLCSLTSLKQFRDVAAEWWSAEFAQHRDVPGSIPATFQHYSGRLAIPNVAVYSDIE